MKNGLIILLFSSLTSICFGQDGTWIRSLALTDYNYPSAVYELNSNKYVVCGSCGNANEYSATCFMLVDSLGTITDQKRNINGFISKNNYTLLTADSGFVTVGFSNKSNAFNYDIYIEKFDKNFIKLWEKSLGNSGWDEGKYITEVSDGYVLCGYLSDTLDANKNAYVAKLDFLGNLVWEKEIDFNGKDEWLNCIKPTKHGTLLTIGTAEQTLEHTNHLFLNFNLNGDTIWSANHDFGNFDNGYYIDERPDSAFVFIGTTYKLPSEDYSDTVNTIVGKIDKNGLVSLIAFNMGIDFNATKIKVLKDGYYLFTGRFIGNNANKVEALIFKISANGVFESSNTAGNNSNYQDVVDFQELENTDRILFLGNNYSNEPQIHNFLLFKTNYLGFFDITDYQSATDITENEPSLGISVYPNPTTHSLNLSDVSGKVSSCQVIDIAGRLVLESPINRFKSLNFELNQGAYFIQLLDTKGRKLKSEKLIIN